MRQNQIKNVPYLEQRRKELRSALTPAEAKLWTMLKNSALQNRKFRRQHSIGNYIVDFYCPSEKLIIELDGQVHYDPVQAAYDHERDKRLTDLGNRVLRFENKVVFEAPESLLAEIERHFIQ
jgi:very-short-patch-repair endonuclease